MLRQRRSDSPYILGVRSLTKDDLSALRQPASRPHLKRMRESHHMIARLAALGKSNNEIAHLAGFNPSRVSLLLHDPSMKELVAKYRDRVDESFAAAADSYATYATSNMITSERMLHDHLEELDEAGERPSIKELLAISSDRADRFGYGKKSTNVNVNVDFAAKLEAARRRSAPVQIEGETFAITRRL